jgi:hypothetical protein
LICGVAALATIGLVVGLIVALSGGGNGVTGYGKDPVAVARKLKLCDQPQRHGSIATCVAAAGGVVSVLTSDNATEQSFLVAMLKDNSPGQCFAVLKGVVVGTADESTLTGAVGIPEDFVNRYDGYLLCPAG